jgi:hypothetical protein
VSRANALPDLAEQHKRTHSSLTARGTIQSVPSARASESAARAALDSACGNNISDAEWGRSRARLLEFVGILRGWNQKTTNAGPGLGNVEALCQREP